MNTAPHKNIERPYHEHPRVLFFLCCLSFLMGVFAGSGGGGGSTVWVFLVSGLILILMTGVRRIMHIGIILTMSIAGYILALDTYRDIERMIESTRPYHTGKHTLVWTIEKDLYTTEFYRAYRMSIDNFDTISPDHVDIDTLRPTILVEIPANLTIHLGDVLVLTGKLTPLYDGRLDGFEKYTFYQKLAGKIRVSGYDKKSQWVPSRFDHIGAYIEEHIFRWFPRDSAGVILGMTIGRVDLMSREVSELFQQSGISHILVVSGSNITFLIVFIGGIIRYFSVQKYIRITLIIVLVLMYSTLVGWDVPVVRSTIMGLLWYYALERWSRLSSVAILSGVAVGFVIYSPLSLMYDAAFWLSFVATMSIILYYQKILSWTRSWHIPWWLGAILALSISASLGTLPVTLYHFTETSVSTIFANIAIAPVVGWVLFFSVWYILLGFLGSYWLYIFWYIIYLPVSYIIEVARVLGSLGMAQPTSGVRTIIVLIGLVFLVIEMLREERIRPVTSQKK